MPYIPYILSDQTYHTQQTYIPYFPSIQYQPFMAYHTYHTFQTCIPDRPYTPYTPYILNIPIHTPTHTTGGRGIVLWLTHEQGRGRGGGWNAGPYICLIIAYYIYILTMLYQLVIHIVYSRSICNYFLLNLIISQFYPLPYSTIS